MSTEHIHQEAEAARKALGQVASAARKRSSELANKRRGLQRERDNLAVGVRAAMRDIDNEDNALEEEEQKLSEILEGLPEPIVEVSEPTVASFTPRATPPAEIVVMEPEAPALRTTLPPPEPEPATAESELPRRVTEQTNNAQQRVVEIIDVRRWTSPQWLVAVLGAIIGLVVANATHGMYDDIEGFGRGLLVFLWFVFMTGFGFFLVGYGGCSFWNHRSSASTRTR